jgi:hypothetical protein
MLRAVLQGKVRPDVAKLLPNSSWRSVFRQVEDLNTAAVFSRLSYLPNPRPWQILMDAAHVHEPIPRRLREVTFWPNWTLEKTLEIGTRRQPDVLLRFEGRDIIVEAKPGDGDGQRPEQWAEQYIAYRSWQREAGGNREVWVFAVGGLGEPPRVPQRQNEARAHVQAKGHDPRGFTVLGCSWLALLRRLQEELADCQPEGPVGRILSDIIEALGLHGVRIRVWLDELPELMSHKGLGELPEAVSAVFARVAAPPKPYRDVEHWIDTAIAEPLDERALSALARRSP